MKILVRAPEERVRQFYDLGSLPSDWELVWAGFERDTATLLGLAGDADAIFVDAVEPIPAELISQMPNLKIIHSEGVGFNMVDCDAAADHGVFVCNNKGANAKAVAEQTILLMLALLRRMAEGDMMVRSGKQIDAKGQFIMDGLHELSELKIGIVGLGDIGKITAEKLHAFEPEILYYDIFRLSPEEEAERRIHYLPIDELLQTCDIVSLHVAVFPDTINLMNRERFSLMKPTALLINTARGELVNQQDLIWALAEGEIAGAGLDCLTPEPVLPDNELLQAPEELRYKLLYSPHIGGVTVGSFIRMHKTVWENITAVSEGKRPINIVNGI